MKLRDVKKQQAEQRRAEEQRAMEEYNQMMEAQARAQKEAIKAVYARQDTLLAIADEKKKQLLAAEAAEKERALRYVHDILPSILGNSILDDSTMVQGV